MYLQVLIAELNSSEIIAKSRKQDEVLHFLLFQVEYIIQF